MSFHKRIFFVLTFLVVLAGCQKGDEVSIQLRSDYLSADAGSSFFAVTASGAWTLSLEFSAGTDAWATVSPSSGTGSINNALLTPEANLQEETRQLTIVLTLASGTPARAVVTQAGTGAAPDWLELPAMEVDKKKELLVHNMQGGKYTGKNKRDTRNWSGYWDYNHRVSLWVAYPLNNGLIGSGERTNAWGYDPLLSADKQYNITKSASRSSEGYSRYYSDPVYDRGHQIPSADRLNNAANVSTFYPTNMTPQNGPFNSGIWANLEGKVRNYAKLADTLYVVTGCVVEGSSVTVTSGDGKRITVPTHYYKAMLYMGGHTSAVKPATGGKKGYMMAAFYLPHDASIASASPLSYRISIDELETKTGIDFFPNFEKRYHDLSQQLEAASPNAQFWN